VPLLRREQQYLEARQVVDRLQHDRDQRCAQIKAIQAQLVPPENHD